MAVRSLSVVPSVALYLGGVAAAVAGALGLSEAVAMPTVLAGALFVLGLGTVLTVHEFLGGPV